MAKTGKCENYRPPRASHVGEGDWRSCATWGTSFTVRTSRTGSGCALRFGGSLPTSFTGRASRPGSDATCVVQRGRCPGLREPRAFGPATYRLSRRRQLQPAKAGTPTCRRTHPRRRRVNACHVDGLGFTLLEILVVLAVLAMLASLTWPSVRRMFDKRELLGAAQEVCAALAKTRLRAIESGVSRQFRWQVGDSHYSMARCGGPEDAQQGARGSRVPSDLLPGDSIEATLAAGLYFGDPAETRGVRRVLVRRVPFRCRTGSHRRPGVARVRRSLDRPLRSGPRSLSRSSSRRMARPATRVSRSLEPRAGMSVWICEG